MSGTLQSISAARPEAKAPVGFAPKASVVSRNLALDFTKGALVLCMIVYHSLNYYRYDPALLRHIHFLPPSFIFIAGFLITHLYLPRIDAGDARVPRRVFVRGLKTLALFVALNLAVHSIFRWSFNRAIGLDVFFDHLDAIFLTGEQRASVFAVLLPISYVLLLSAVLLSFTRIARRLLYIVAGGIFALCVIVAFRGHLVFNLELVSMGLLGAVVGFVPLRFIERSARHLVLLAVAYLGYTVCVFFRYPTFLMNTVGVCLVLLVFYGLGLRCASNSVVSRAVNLLGNYPLLSYLVQIAVLQTLLRLGHHIGLVKGEFVVPMLLTTAATLGVIRVVKELRQRMKLADAAYKAVFG